MYLCVQSSAVVVLDRPGGRGLLLLLQLHHLHPLLLLQMLQKSHIDCSANNCRLSGKQLAHIVIVRITVQIKTLNVFKEMYLLDILCKNDGSNM